MQLWFSLPIFFLILWPDLVTFQPTLPPFPLIHCLPKSRSLLYSVSRFCPHVLNPVSMLWSVRILKSHRSLCSRFPVCSQGHNYTNYHSGRSRIFLTDLSGFPWAHHVCSCFLSAPILCEQPLTMWLTVSLYYVTIASRT